MGLKKWMLSLLAVGVLFALPLGVESQAGSRYRDLDRALEESGYSEAENEAVARAFGAALKAGQQRREAVDLVELCIEGEFGAAATARVLHLYTQLELENLPDEGFRLKIREGVVKRASSDAILRAAEQQALGVNRAQNIVNRLILKGYDVDDAEELIDLVAEALAAGKDEAEIREILTGALEDGDGTRKIRRALLR